MAPRDRLVRFDLTLHDADGRPEWVLPDQEFPAWQVARFLQQLREARAAARPVPRSPPAARHWR